MRAAIFNGPRQIGVGDRPDPTIAAATDAVVRVVLGCVCGSDLWYYRGESPHDLGPIGHEFIGVVTDIGSDVEVIAEGDFVVSPFTFNDGTCPHCLAGWTSNCTNGGGFGNHGMDGGQGEGVRVPFADATLVKVPGSGHDDATMRSLLALSGVMGTGHHAAISGDVKRGDAATEAVLAMTDGVGVDAALECVGTNQSMATAFAIARPGSMVGAVGVPHDTEVPINTVIFRNIGLRGGVAPVRRYLPELLHDVLAGGINPGRVFDFDTDLEGIAEAYAAMDERRAVKALIRIGSAA